MRRIQSTTAFVTQRNNPHDSFGCIAWEKDNWYKHNVRVCYDSDYHALLRLRTATELYRRDRTGKNLGRVFMCLDAINRKET